MFRLDDNAPVVWIDDLQSETPQSGYDCEGGTWKPSADGKVYRLTVAADFEVTAQDDFGGTAGSDCWRGVLNVLLRTMAAEFRAAGCQSPEECYEHIRTLFPHVYVDDVDDTTPCEDDEDDDPADWWKRGGPSVN